VPGEEAVADLKQHASGRLEEILERGSQRAVGQRTEGGAGGRRGGGPHRPKRGEHVRLPVRRQIRQCRTPHPAASRGQAGSRLWKARSTATSDGAQSDTSGPSEMYEVSGSSSPVARSSRIAPL